MSGTKKAKDFRDIEQVLGTPVEVTVGDRRYKLSPLRLSDHAEARNKIRTDALTAYNAYINGLPPNERPDPMERQAQVARILTERLADVQVFQWWDTLEGMQYVIWQSLSKCHPDISMDDIEAMLLDVEQLSQLTSALAEISGLRGGGEAENPPPASTPSGSKTSPDSADSTAGPTGT